MMKVPFIGFILEYVLHGRKNGVGEAGLIQSQAQYIHVQFKNDF